MLEQLANAQLAAETERFKAIVGLVATVLGAVVVAAGGTVGGLLITRKLQRERNEQDRESQWRSHAVELTKLEAERLLKTRKEGQPIAPFILTFLAHYRDLSELGRITLGSKTPAELYRKIKNDRIAASVEKVSMIESGALRATVVCPDDASHPRVFLTLERDHVAACPYCSRVFVLRGPRPVAETPRPT